MPETGEAAPAAERRAHQLLADAERARLFAENAGHRGRLSGLVTRLTRPRRDGASPSR